MGGTLKYLFATDCIIVGKLYKLFLFIELNVLLVKLLLIMLGNIFYKNNLKSIFLLFILIYNILKLGYFIIILLFIFIFIKRKHRHTSSVVMLITTKEEQKRSHEKERDTRFFCEFKGSQIRLY